MRDTKILIGKILVALSLVIILFGVILDFSDKGLSEVKDTDNSNDTPITTVDEDRPTGSSILESNSRVSDNPTDIINSINNNYGIDVKYEGIDSYSTGGYSIVPITDDSLISSSLNKLVDVLSLYPEGFFMETKSELPLSIYLVKSYSKIGVTGITEKKNSGVIISIAVDYPLEDTFNHEVFHYMEHYINSQGGTFSNWNNYNPSGFTYGTYDNKYAYDVTFSEDAYFVNTYAESYEYEDRASTFEYMMADSKISTLNNGKHIWLKAKVMCEVIDYYFDTVTSDTTEYWERYI